MPFACAADMLTEGLPTGQATRLLFTPYRRKVEVEEGEGEEAGTGKESDAERAGSDAGSGLNHELGEEGGGQMLPDPSWYNMVCYGLPNLVITQV